MQTDKLELKNPVHLYLMNYSVSETWPSWRSSICAGLLRSQSSDSGLGSQNHGVHMGGQDNRLSL